MLHSAPRGSLCAEAFTAIEADLRGFRATAGLRQASELFKLSCTYYSCNAPSARTVYSHPLAPRRPQIDSLLTLSSTYLKRSYMVKVSGRCEQNVHSKFPAHFMLICSLLHQYIATSHEPLCACGPRQILGRSRGRCCLRLRQDSPPPSLYKPL